MGVNEREKRIVRLVPPRPREINREEIPVD